MPNFLGIDQAFSNYEDAKVVVVPVPFERTTSYGGGTRYGPQAIIEASAYVELYDEELRYEPYKQGVHTSDPVETEGNIETVFDNITDRFSNLLQDGKFPAALGGEHSITFPIFRAFDKRYKPLSVLQLDAHSDLRSEYEGSIYSHASVMHRIMEMNPRIVQVGIRAQCVEEARLIETKGIHTHYAHDLRQNGLNERIIDDLEEHVYITIDVDFFDPSMMPATGTPEPGGFFWTESVRFLKKLFEKRNVVGFDVVETSPVNGLHHAEFTVARLIYKLMAFKYGWTRNE